MKQSLSPEDRARYAEVFDGWVKEARDAWELHVWEPVPTVEEIVRRYGQ